MSINHNFWRERWAEAGSRTCVLLLTSRAPYHQAKPAHKHFSHFTHRCQCFPSSPSMSHPELYVPDSCKATVKSQSTLNTLYKATLYKAVYTLQSNTLQSSVHFTKQHFNKAAYCCAGCLVISVGGAFRNTQASSNYCYGEARTQVLHQKLHNASTD